MPGIGPNRAIKDSMMWSSQGILSFGIRIASEMDRKCAQMWGISYSAPSEDYNA